MPTLLMLGAGRMGGALLQGWSHFGPITMAEVLIRDPHPGEDAEAAVERGALLDPSPERIAQADIVVLAVKPQMWREAAAAIEPHLAPDALIVSIMAGVSIAAIAEVFGGRPVARVMPMTAAAVGQGVTSIFSRTYEARVRAADLFRTLGAVVEIGDEQLMHAATAVAGSGPAYFYAFVEALEAAGVKAGFSQAQAVVLAQHTFLGAAALLDSDDKDPAELRRQVTSPGGTTQAALEVLMGEGGLGPLLAEAVAAAVARSKELG